MVGPGELSDKANSNPFVCLNVQNCRSWARSSMRFVDYTQGVRNTIWRLVFR